MQYLIETISSQYDPSGRKQDILMSFGRSAIYLHILRCILFLRRFFEIHFKTSHYYCFCGLIKWRPKTIAGRYLYNK